MSGTGLRRKSLLNISCQFALRCVCLGASACRDKPQDADCVVGRKGGVAGPSEEGKLFVHFAPSWRISRTIRECCEVSCSFHNPLRDFHTRTVTVQNIDMCLIRSSNYTGQHERIHKTYLVAENHSSAVKKEIPGDGIRCAAKT